MHASIRPQSRLFVSILICAIVIWAVEPVLIPPHPARARGLPDLPRPGTMVTPTPTFVPPHLKGMTIHPERPLQFDFIIDPGHATLRDKALRKEALKLIKYFLASLTIPERDLWVNLSPYENTRIIPDDLNRTEMGRTLLTQDYILKQLTASLLYPEESLGRRFWDRIYKKARRLYGTEKIPINTFNKVWIVPDKAVVYEAGDTVIVTESHLKVMLERDYLSAKKGPGKKRKKDGASGRPEVSGPIDVSSDVFKSLVLPEIEKEVNFGKNFAPLRQVYQSMILAVWYKKKLKESPLTRVYADRKKIRGIDIEDKGMKQEIYARYLDAFRKGVFNYIKEDYDATAQRIIPRRYFAGGIAPLSRGTVVQERSLPPPEKLRPVSKGPFAMFRIGFLPASDRKMEIFRRFLRKIASKRAGRSLSDDTFSDREAMQRVAEDLVAQGLAEESEAADVVDEDAVRRSLPDGLKFAPRGRVILIKIKEEAVRDHPLLQSLKDKFVNAEGEAIRGVNFPATETAPPRWRGRGLIVMFENEWKNDADVRRHEFIELGIMLSNPELFDPKDNNAWVAAHNLTVEIMGAGGPIDRVKLAKYKGTIGAGLGNFFRRRTSRNTSTARSEDGRETSPERPRAQPSQSNRLTIFGSPSAYRDWEEVLLKEKRWHTGVDFRKLLGKNRVLVLGDTNHGLIGIQRHLAELVPELKKAGVTHLGLEIPSDLTPSDIDEIARSVWVPHRFKQLVQAARHMGMEVVFIDMPESERKDSWSAEETSFHRGVSMGDHVAGFLRHHPKAVMAVITGYKHILDYDQIPARLDEGGFPSTLVPVVTEGQPNLSSFSAILSGFFQAPVVEAIASYVTKTNRYGYIDLQGLPFEIPGARAILHFPRPRTGRSKDQRKHPEGQWTALDVRSRLTRITPIPETEPMAPLSIDFQNRIEPHVGNWAETNVSKILQFVGRLEGLTPGQRIYLAALLAGYAENTGRHSLNGSILEISFVPDGRFFEITTVDTAGYPYREDVEYGARKQHWEVSLQTLDDRFGFEDLLVRDVSEIPETHIQGNPQRPSSGLKVLLLRLAALKHPERIIVGSLPAPLTVYRGEPGISLPIAKLDLHDFLLTAMEEDLRESVRLTEKLSLPLLSLDALFKEQLSSTKINLLKKRKIQHIQETLKKAWESMAVGVLWNKLRHRIIEARSRLDVLRGEPAIELIALLDDAIAGAEGSLKEIKAYTSKNKTLLNLRLEGSGATVRVSIAKIEYLLGKLKNRRARFHTHPEIEGPASRTPQPRKETAVPASVLKFDESVVPRVRPGFVRYLYFTGKTDKEALYSLMTEGPPLEKLGKNHDVWEYQDLDFEDYIFHERDGELGYVVMVDIPEELIETAKRNEGVFWKNLKTRIGIKRPPGSSGSSRLRAQFIIGAIDQRTGAWVDPILSASSPTAAQPPGGIDFNARWLTIESRGSRDMKDFFLLPLETAEIRGLTPFVLDVSPLPSLTPLLKPIHD